KVGYVIENPIWKTSYRLVLGAEKSAKPYLQGWAVVENPSDEDWKDIRMALISGRPISFQMNLYDPLFIQRPIVDPELFASLRPPTYSGGLALSEPMPAPKAFAPPPMDEDASFRKKDKGEGKPGSTDGTPFVNRLYKNAANKREELMDLQQGV